MSILKALILGILQGLTEFLPVSSSGHLVVMQHYLGFKQPMLLFDALLHIATLAVVIIYFRKDLYEITLDLIGLKRGHRKEISARTLYLILLGTIPTALIGLSFKKWIEASFTMNFLTPGMFLFTGTLLWIGEKKAKVNKEMDKISIMDALIIGTAQGIAITPGISRSGATISVGLLRGVKKEAAFHYSFLLSIPAIIGAMGIELREAALKENLPHQILPWMVGALAAFLVGYLSLMVLRKALLRRKFFLFAIYCWIIGGGLFIIQLIGRYGG